MNVTDVLDKLLELQDVEIAILREKNRLEGLKRRKKELLKKRNEFKEKLAFLKDEINRMEAAVKDLKDFIAYKQERLEELKKQKEHATDRKTFKDILRQIAKTEDEIIRAKAELARLEVELEELEERSKEERAFLKEAIEKVSDEINTLEKKIEKQKEEVSELELKAVSLREELPEDVWKEYECLKKKYNGLVFSDISSGACEGCGMSYSSAEFAAILKELEPGKTRCPYCGRFVIKLK